MTPSLIRNPVSPETGLFFLAIYPVIGDPSCDFGCIGFKPSHGALGFGLACNLAGCSPDTTGPCLSYPVATSQNGGAPLERKAGQGFSGRGDRNRLYQFLTKCDCLMAVVTGDAYPWIVTPN